MLAVVGAVLGVVALIWIIGGLIGTDDDVPVVDAARSGAAPASSPPAGAPLSGPSSSSSSSAAAVVAPIVTTTKPPDPNLPCPDAAIAVTAELGTPTYKVGKRPLLRLIVTNAGAVPCTRDIGREHRELLVTSRDGATRFWSSNDCAVVKGKQSKVLAPGERASFEVLWAGRTSGPGCPVGRKAVPAGEYSVTPKLGPLVGTAVPPTLTP